MVSTIRTRMWIICFSKVSAAPLAKVLRIFMAEYTIFQIFLYIFFCALRKVPSFTGAKLMKITGYVP